MLAIRKAQKGVVSKGGKEHAINTGRTSGARPRRAPSTTNLTSYHPIPCTHLTYTYLWLSPCLTDSLHFADRPVFPCARLPVISLNRRYAMKERNHGSEIAVSMPPFPLKGFKCFFQNNPTFVVSIVQLAFGIIYSIIGEMVYGLVSKGRCDRYTEWFCNNNMSILFDILSWILVLKMGLVYGKDRVRVHRRCRLFINRWLLTFL